MSRSGRLHLVYLDLINFVNLENDRISSLNKLSLSIVLYKILIARIFEAPTKPIIFYCLSPISYMCHSHEQNCKHPKIFVANMLTNFPLTGQYIHDRSSSGEFMQKFSLSFRAQMNSLPFFPCGHIDHKIVYKLIENVSRISYK